MADAGRPTKLTPELQKKICDEVCRGTSQETAALLAGIQERTLYYWIERGKAGKEPYLQFFQDLMRARAEHISALEQYWTRHAITDWRAAQAKLAALDPARYASPIKHEIRFAGMSDAELDAYIAAAERPALEAGEGGAGAPGAGAADSTQD